jgi:hypothetical protein
MDQAAGEWVVVWQRAGHGADIDGDMAVSLLEGSGLPVRRVPSSRAPVVFDGMGGPMMPVRVLVPEAREAEARELLGEDAVPPRVAGPMVAAPQRAARRTWLYWVIGALVALGVLLLLPYLGHGWFVDASVETPEGQNAPWLTGLLVEHRPEIAVVTVALLAIVVWLVRRAARGRQ